MIAKCAVTYEFPTRPPETWRGTIEAFGEGTIVRRAIQAAKKELKPKYWSSLVVVILEREDDSDEETAVVEEDESL